MGRDKLSPALGQIARDTRVSTKGIRSRLTVTAGAIALGASPADALGLAGGHTNFFAAQMSGAGQPTQANAHARC